MRNDGDRCSRDAPPRVDSSAERSARERLFDVLMRRFEALAPYEESIRSLLHSARTDPPLALGRGQQISGVFDRVCRFLPGCGSRRRARPQHSTDVSGGDAVAV